MKKPKMRLIIVNEDTGEEFFNEVSEDLTYNMSNDLYTVPTFLSDYQAPPKYSRGILVKLDAYFINPNADKEYKECMEEVVNRARAKRG